MAGALLVGAAATVSSLYLLTLGGQERFEPLEVASSVVATIKPGAPIVAPEPLEDTAEPAPEPIVERVNLDQPTSIQEYLENAGMDTVEADQWAKAFKAAAYTGLMHDGHQLSLFKDPETGKIRGLQYDIDEKTAVAEEALGNGVVLATQEPLRYVNHAVPISFSIKESLEADAAQSNVPKRVVERLKDAFRDQLPLERLRKGTAIKLVYEEQVSSDGSHRQIGDLDAAQVDTGATKVSAIYFRDEYGIPHYYDEHGNPTSPQFLRFPVNFQYISSGFSSSRYHPILHRYRPHAGVDLAAQYGTPVKAVADGRVGFSDWDGELGRCIKLDHQKELTSLYGHLSKISPDIKPGAPVRTGQVIGWVGASGLATGPHLHFALFKEGSYVDPLSMKYTRGADMSRRTRPLFEKIKREYMSLLSKLPDLSARDNAPKPAISTFEDLYQVEAKTPSSKSLRHASRSARHRRAPDRDVELGAGSM